MSRTYKGMVYLPARGHADGACPHAGTLSVPACGHAVTSLPITSPNQIQQSAMQMNGCRHLVPLYPYHANNYSY